MNARLSARPRTLVAFLVLCIVIWTGRGWLRHREVLAAHVSLRSELAVQCDELARGSLALASGELTEWWTAAGAPRLAEVETALAEAEEASSASLAELRTVAEVADGLERWLTDAESLLEGVRAAAAEWDGDLTTSDLAEGDVEWVRALRQRWSSAAEGALASCDVETARSLAARLAEGRDETLVLAAERAETRVAIEVWVAARGRARGLLAGFADEALDAEPVVALRERFEAADGVFDSAPERVSAEYADVRAAVVAHTEDDGRALYDRARAERKRDYGRAESLGRAAGELGEHLSDAQHERLEVLLSEVGEARGGYDAQAARAGQWLTQLARWRVAAGPETSLGRVLGERHASFGARVRSAAREHAKGRWPAATEELEEAVEELATLEEAWRERGRLDFGADYVAAVEGVHGSLRGSFAELTRVLDAARTEGDAKLAESSGTERAVRAYRAGAAQAIEVTEPLIEAWLEHLWSLDDTPTVTSMRAAAKAQRQLATQAALGGHESLCGKALVARALAEQQSGSWSRARALYDEARALFAELGDPLWEAEGHSGVAGCLTVLDEPDWTGAVRHMRRAIELFDQAGHIEYQRRCEMALAAYLQPDANPGGDWNEAMKAYERAEGLARALDDEGAERLAIAARADCLRPYRNPKGSWKRAADLYLRVHAGDPNELRSIATDARPDRAQKGDWATAVRLVDAAVAALRLRGANRALADGLADLADVVNPENNPAGTHARLAKVYAEYADVIGGLGERADAANVFCAAARQVMPSEHPPGSWSGAAAYYGRAAEHAGRASDKKLLALTLHQQAYCLFENNSSRMTDQARRLFERAAGLSRSAGDENSARISESFLRPNAAAGSVQIRRTWNNGSESLGASSYNVGLRVELDPRPRAYLTYRGQKLELTHRGQQFQVRPYDNTSATCTVQRFDVSESGVAIHLSSRGMTRNPSSVFSGGYRHAFSGDLAIAGAWTQSGLDVAVEERNRFDGLGNAEWEGRASLARAR
jgi:tetratricopeptide (TPR) repeat protein